jgi:two-component system, sensor histidine kinase PdtaS
MTLKTKLLSGIFVFLIRWVAAQPTTNHVGIDKYPYSSLSAYLGGLKNAKEDTAKVDLLLKIGCIYFWEQSGSSADSAISFARTAGALSKSLKYSMGYNNSIYLICASLLLKRDFESAKLMLKEVYGEMYICILLALAEYYVNDNDAKPDKLRKAYPYLRAADSLSSKQQSRHWMTESIIAKAKYHFRLGEMTSGKNCFYRVIRYHEQIGDKAGQAHWWEEQGRYTPDTDSTYAIQIYSLKKARVLFHEIGDHKEEAACLQLIGYIHSLHDRPDLAEKFYLSEIQTLKSAKVDRKLPTAYQKISLFYQTQNDFDKALRYALLGLNKLKAKKDSSELSSVYLSLGNIYRGLGDHSSSIKYYKLVLSSNLLHKYWTSSVIKLLIEAQIETGNAAEALNFLKSFLRSQKAPETRLNTQLIACLFGNCYAALNRFDEAEKYYLEMIRINKELETSKRFSWSSEYNLAGAEAYLTIGRFYVRKGKFHQAAPYIKSALASKNRTPLIEMNSRHLIFKADSAAGNYLASIGNYQRYIFLRDSIAKNTKDKEVSILKATFRTAQKEKDFKILQNEATLQKQKLELSARTEKFAYAGLAVLLCLLGLSYNRYRLKQNKNLQLEEQQKTINIKNSSLIRLINEKEWLLKEVHHRVKNNLQIVISLLNSQSVYLKEDVAINAILESRHRIQAMSMLHQRIYQSQNMSGISMRSYIHELVYYLDNSFKLGKRIIISVVVEDIQMDLLQAVPVGLILNEAVTNSLKYAFPDQREGEIKVSLEKTEAGKLLLCIADDGIGLPPDFNMNEIKSFGLKLIKGLTEDLEGEFRIEEQPGTTLLIAFEYKTVMDSLPYQDNILEMGT